MQISPILMTAFITSTACGDEKLLAELTGQAATLECLAAARPCATKDVRLTYYQIVLADTALGWTRGMIDQANEKADSFGKSFHKSSAYQDSETGKTQQATSWSRSRQRGENNFSRTGESADKAFSVMRASGNGQSFATMQDDSKRGSGSQSISWDDMTARGSGNGSGKSNYSSSRSSGSAGGTGPETGVLPNPFEFSTNLNWKPGENVGSQYPAISGATIPIIATGSPELKDVTCAAMNAIPSIPPIPGVSLFDRARILQLACEPHPHQAVSLHDEANFNWTVSSGFLNLFGTTVGATSKWESGMSWNESSVCTVSLGSMSASSNAYQRYKQTDFSMNEGSTEAQTFGYEKHNRRSCGGAEQKSTSASHAASNGESFSCGESHSFDVRRGHAEGQTSTEGKSFMERHSESMGEQFSRASALRTRDKYNQVFSQLSKLRGDLMSKLKQQEALHAGNRLPVAECADPRIPKHRTLGSYVNAAQKHACGVGCMCGN